MEEWGGKTAQEGERANDKVPEERKSKIVSVIIQIHQLLCFKKVWSAKPIQILTQNLIVNILHEDMLFRTRIRNPKKHQEITAQMKWGCVSFFQTLYISFL